MDYVNYFFYIAPNFLDITPDFPGHYLTAFILQGAFLQYIKKHSSFIRNEQFWEIYKELKIKKKKFFVQ